MICTRDDLVNTQDMTDPVKTYSVREAAQALGLSEVAIRRLIRSGQVGARRAGRRVLIPAEALREYVDGLEEYR